MIRYGCSVFMVILLPRKTAESNCNPSVQPASNRRSRHREVVFQASPSQASLQATATGNAGQARRRHVTRAGYGTRSEASRRRPRAEPQVGPHRDDVLEIA